MSGRDASCGCREHTRSDLIRRAAAEAGRGLPAIETGMPLPAGTGLDRRTFVLGSLGAAVSVFGGAKLLGRSALEAGVAQAATARKGPVLVSVFLDGGLDSLSALFPAGDPLYRKLRPKLALSGGAGQAFAADERLRWHPALGPIATLHGEGKVTVFPAVGYTHADQSHFTSRHYWEVGATDAQLRTGWLGRYLDTVGTQDNPLQGLSLDGRLHPSLATAQVPVATIERPDQYDFYVPHVWGDVEERMLDAIGSLGTLRGDPAFDQAAGVARQVDDLRRQLLPFRSKDGKPGFTSPVTYPKSDDSFPIRLASLAAMIEGGFPLRCVALSAPGGYDTHSGQPKTLNDGLQLTAASLYWFQRDLEARGIADRVLVHVWSEFGRRAQENGSNGTDHGAAGLGLLIGSRASGELVGEFPGLASGLDDNGNLVATSDFRGVYSALLEQWFDADAEALIPGAKGFDRPALVK